MLDHQWFFLEAANDSLVDNALLPLSRKTVAIRTADKRWQLEHGLNACCEETAEHYCIAVGDTRGLKNLSGFRTSGPARHATILTIEKNSGCIRILTDRINYSKVFCLTTQAGFALSTHLSLFDCSNLQLSAAGVASCIANGTQFFTSSVFEQIQVLERASIHAFDEAGHHAEPYWVYGFGNAVAPRTAKEKLKECLIESVRDQVCNRPLLLSLSGGFDSAGIFGILSKFAKPDQLQTFSYVHGVPEPGTDALVAQRTASLLGYPHEILESYQGDLSATIARNAALGQGISNFCDEIDAWQKQGSEHTGSVLIAGDESFGWSDRRLTSKEDVLATVVLRPFTMAAALFPYLDEKVQTTLSNALANLIDSIVARSREESLHDMKDFLYLDQRIHSSLLPWRRFINGEFFDVREPYLTTDLLELIRTLPQEDRIGKALYREAVVELLPDVFKIPRARTGQTAPAWKKELILNQEGVRLSLNRPSQLDQIIPPDAIRKMLDSLYATPEEKQGLKMLMRQIAGPALTRVLRKYVRPEGPKSHPSERILLRLLTLREFLIA